MRHETRDGSCETDTSARWAVMLAELAGDTLPALPSIAGRVHLAEDKDLEDEPSIAREMTSRAARVFGGWRGPKP